MRLLDQVAVLDADGRFMTHGRIWGKDGSKFDVLPLGCLRLCELMQGIPKERLKPRSNELKLIKG